MRATIEHREEAAGMSGNGRDYFVDCTVEFSEEEKAIIQARALQDRNFVAQGADPPRSTASFAGAAAMKAFAPIIGIGGFIWGVFGGGGLAGLLVFGSIGMFIYGVILNRRPLGASEPQVITIQQLVTDGRFTVYANDPASAKAIDDQLRQDLAAVKAMIAESAEVRSKQTFEC